MSQLVSSKSGTLDINKYITGFPSVVGGGSQEDINLIEIYFINRGIPNENVIDVSVKNSLETFIDNYYKKSRVEKYKSYTHKERIYTYELSNDNQFVSSKIKKHMDILDNIFVICSKNNKQPNYTFPCTNEIDSVSEYIIKEYKISNRISLIMRSDVGDSGDGGEEIKTLYIEYRHSNNVDIDKINETINKIIRKILYQASHT
uniref:Uncharacterized protein n=1 Tax=viral metagenome TaxID=1070528 RepID=A0A6C0LB27_9ZZZZ